MKGTDLNPRSIACTLGLTGAIVVWLILVGLGLGNLGFVSILKLTQ